MTINHGMDQNSYKLFLQLTIIIIIIIICYKLYNIIFNNQYNNNVLIIDILIIDILIIILNLFVILIKPYVDKIRNYKKIILCLLIKLFLSITSLTIIELMTTCYNDKSQDKLYRTIPEYLTLLYNIELMIVLLCSIYLEIKFNICETNINRTSKQQINVV
jgi:hypothetical protein